MRKAGVTIHSNAWQPTRRDWLSWKHSVNWKMTCYPTQVCVFNCSVGRFSCISLPALLPYPFFVGEPTPRVFLAFASSTFASFFDQHRVACHLLSCSAFPPSSPGRSAKQPRKSVFATTLAAAASAAAAGADAPSSPLLSPSRSAVPAAPTVRYLFRLPPRGLTTMTVTLNNGQRYASPSVDYCSSNCCGGGGDVIKVVELSSMFIY
jgi:hypothetical protein